MDRTRGLLLNSLTSFLQQVVALICGLILPRLIIGHYGSTVNGTISSVTQFISLTSLIQGGLTSAVRVAFYGPVSNHDVDKTSEVYYTSKRYYRIFSACIFLYTVFLAFLYPKFVDTGLTYYDCFLLVIVLGVSAISDSLFGIINQLLTYADQRAYLNTSLVILVTVINTVVSVVLIREDVSIIVLKAVTVIVSFIRPAVLGVYVKKQYRLIHPKKVNHDLLKQSGAALSKSIAYFVHMNTDNIVITFFMPVKWVSVYSVHKFVFGSISTLISSILGNTEAVFGQMIARKENDRLKDTLPIYDLMTKIISSIFFFTTMVLITPFVDLYTNTITDAQYHQPVFAIIMCFAELTYCMSLTYNNVIMAAGHIRETQWISYGEAIINIVLSVILVNRYGIVGVGIGTLAAFIFNTVANYFYMKQHIINIRGKDIAGSYLTCLLPGMAILFLCGRFIRFSFHGYVMFFISAFAAFLVVSLSIIGVNFIFYKDELIMVYRTIKERRKPKRSE